MNQSYVNHDALKRRFQCRAAKAAKEAEARGASREEIENLNMKAGKIYMDGKPYDSMEDLFFKGFSKDEQDIMLGKNPFVKVRY